MNKIDDDNNAAAQLKYIQDRISSADLNSDTIQNINQEDYEESENEYLNTVNGAIKELCHKLQDNKEKIRLLQEILLFGDDEQPKASINGTRIFRNQKSDIQFDLGSRHNKPKVYHPAAQKHLTYKNQNQKKFDWNDEKDDLLQKYHNEGNNYDVISQKLGTTVQECAQRMARFRTSKYGVRWTAEMDDLLTHLVLKHGENQFQWIARIFNNDPLIQNIKQQFGITSHWNHNQLSYRWFNSINPNLTTGQWSVEEDVRLVLTAKVFDGNNNYHGQWADIQEYMPHRNQVQIRERLSCLRKNGVDVSYNRKVLHAFTGEVKVEKIEDHTPSIVKKNKKIISARKASKKKQRNYTNKHNRKTVKKSKKKIKDVKVCGRKNSKTATKIKRL